MKMRFLEVMLCAGLLLLSSASHAAGCTPLTTISGTVDCAGATVHGGTCYNETGDAYIFVLKDGAVLKNVNITSSGLGIACEGTCTLVNVNMLNTNHCFTAFTLLPTGKSMTVEGGSAAYFGDRVILDKGTGPTTVNVNNFFASNIGMFYRSCGNCANNGNARNVSISNTKLEAVSVAVAGINTNFKDTATIRTLKIKGYKSGKPPVCLQYKGVRDTTISATKIGEAWNTTQCKLTKADVTAY